MMVRRPLANRLLRVIFGCYFGVAILVTAGQIVSEYRNAHRRLETDIQAMQRTFGRGLADAVWNFNTGVLHGILNGIAEMPVVVGVEVRDEHGRVLDSISAGNTKRRGLAVFDQPFEREFDLEYVDENHRSHPLGRWVVRSNDVIVFSQVRDTLIIILINSMLKTLALWAIFWMVIRRMVGRPLSQITGFLTRLDADNLGTEPLRLETRESDELHLLAGVFNTMATKLRRAFDANAALMRDLKDANATLQIRVEERTRDLERLARTDQLTGIRNRRSLDEALEQALACASTGSRLSMILGDIDRFKAINDQHGHSAGDIVLVGFTKILQAAVRPNDILGRWGGEEFMILCPDTDLQSALALAEAMCLRIAGTDQPIVGMRTCSFGVAELSKGEGRDSLLNRADAALYAAKRNGRNRVELATNLPSQRSAA